MGKKTPSIKRNAPGRLPNTNPKRIQRTNMITIRPHTLGQRTAINQRATALNMSVNAYILDLLEVDIRFHGTEEMKKLFNPDVVSPPETLTEPPVGDLNFE